MPFEKGKSGNKEGRPKGALSKKRADWEAMGETLTGAWTEYLMMYGNDLIKSKQFEEFYPLYKDMVNYFKPRLSSQQVKADIDATVKSQPLINFGDTSEKDAT